MPGSLPVTSVLPGPGPLLMLLCAAGTRCSTARTGANSDDLTQDTSGQGAISLIWTSQHFTPYSSYHRIPGVFTSLTDLLLPSRKAPSPCSLHCGSVPDFTQHQAHSKHSHVLFPWMHLGSQRLASSIRVSVFLVPSTVLTHEPMIIKVREAEERVDPLSSWGNLNNNNLKNTLK